MSVFLKLASAWAANFPLSEPLSAPSRKRFGWCCTIASIRLSTRVTASLGVKVFMAGASFKAWVLRNVHSRKRPPATLFSRKA